MEYKHFSHQHNLSLYQTQPGQQFRCSGCEKTCLTSSYYVCWECNFFLHEHCGNAKRFVKHPSHPQHPLILLPSPTYCGGTFTCNGCGEGGEAFSYCCALCEVDLHVRCAFLPPKVTHTSHTHELNLNYPTQQKEAPFHNCKLCNKPLQPKQWDYNCLKCDFHVHTFCATNEVKPGLYLDDHDDSCNATSAAPSGYPTASEEGVERSEDQMAELLNLQLQMQMAQQMAEMMASYNLASLV